MSVRFARRLTAWSRRDKARPTLPLGFCSGLISYPARRAGASPTLPFEVFRDSHPHTAFLRVTAYDLELVPVELSSSTADEFHKTRRDQLALDADGAILVRGAIASHEVTEDKCINEWPVNSFLSHAIFSSPRLTCPFFADRL